MAFNYSQAYQLKAAPDWNNQLTPRTVATENVTLLDECESTVGWTPTSAAPTLNPTTKFRGDNSLRLTTNAGATGFVIKSFANPLPAIGRTFRAWVNIPDLTKVSQVQFLVWFGPTGSSNYYTFQFSKATSRLVEGEQIFEYNLGYNSTARSVVGAPDPTLGITQIRLIVTAEAGEVAVVDFDQLEMVQRKPKLMMINDSPYNEFVGPIVPELEKRNMPYTVQLPKALLAGYTADGTYTGNASLAKFRQMMKRGAVAGLHFDARPAVDDTTFYTDSRLQLKQATDLGLLEKGFLASAVQGAWSGTVGPTTTTRLDWASNIAGLCRRGDAITDAGILGTTIVEAGVPHHGFGPDSPMCSYHDIPTLEFGQSLTTGHIDTYFADALANENFFSIFGHGVETTPGQLYRSPQSIYDYFFAKLDTVIDKFDIVSPASCLAASIRNPRYRIGLFSYRPSGLKVR